MDGDEETLLHLERRDELTTEYLTKVGRAVHEALNPRTLAALLEAIRIDPERVNFHAWLIGLDVVGKHWRRVGEAQVSAMTSEERDRYLREGEDSDWRRDLRATLDIAVRQATHGLVKETDQESKFRLPDQLQASLELAYVHDRDQFDAQVGPLVEKILKDGGGHHVIDP